MTRRRQPPVPLGHQRAGLVVQIGVDIEVFLEMSVAVENVDGRRQIVAMHREHRVDAATVEKPLRERGDRRHVVVDVAPMVAGQRRPIGHHVGADVETGGVEDPWHRQVPAASKVDRIGKQLAQTKTGRSERPDRPFVPRRPCRSKMVAQLQGNRPGRLFVRAVEHYTGSSRVPTSPRPRSR